MTGLLETLAAWQSAQQEAMHTCMPGIIVSYEGHATRRARVQPAVRLELGTGPIIEIPPIDGVPVVFPSSSESSLLFPLNPGDGCLLLFSEAGIGNYLAGRGIVSDPDDQSRFSLTDAIAIPGLFPWKKVPRTTAPADATWLGSSKGASLGLGERVRMANGSSDLRREFDALWDRITDLYTQMASLAPLTTEPGVATTPNPAQVAALNTAKAQASSRKAEVQNFLE